MQLYSFESSPAAQHAGQPSQPSPTMPKEHGTTSYGIGKVYLNTKQQYFRVIFDKKKPSKEKMLKWASSKPCQAEWIHALQLIDNYMSSL